MDDRSAGDHGIGTADRPYAKPLKDAVDLSREAAWQHPHFELGADRAAADTESIVMVDSVESRSE